MDWWEAMGAQGPPRASGHREEDIQNYCPRWSSRLTNQTPGDSGYSLRVLELVCAVFSDCVAAGAGGGIRPSGIPACFSLFV